MENGTTQSVHEAAGEFAKSCSSSFAATPKLAQQLFDSMVRLNNERAVLAETRRRALRELLAPLSQRKTYQTILRVVETVAWQKGFSHVRSIDENDLWWSPEIDITDDVVNALHANAAGE